MTEVDGLSQRLMGAAFALAGMAPRRYERVASAGPAKGILEPLLVRAYLHAGTAYPATRRGRCLLAPHQGGATILYAGGVARHVVRPTSPRCIPRSCARSASARHAIAWARCCTWWIVWPSCGCTTSVRRRPRRRQRAPRRSRHDALQAAMKIVINAAYGYMGAGQMALFADRARPTR